jgi:protein ImuA
MDAGIQTTHLPDTISERRVIAHPAVFRLGDAGEGLRSSTSTPTGFSALNASLSDGGWPACGLVELLSDAEGIGELSLLLPALMSSRRRDDTARKHLFLLIAPPYLPYAPALADAGIDLADIVIVEAAKLEDRLWVAEQALSSGAVDGVLLWATCVLHDTALRRLKHAATTGESLCWLMRPKHFASHASPANLRLTLQPAPCGQLHLRIIKQRGLPPSKYIALRTRTLHAHLREARTTPQDIPASTPQTARAWLERAMLALSAPATSAASIRHRSIAPDR